MKKIKVLLTMLLMCMTVASFAQNITVKGVVTDASNGEPLSGATILVKGTHNGVVADNDGRYSISVPAEGTLGFVTIGFKDVEIAVNGRTEINVKLEPDTELLDDVLVVAYGSMSKTSFTGTATQVKGEQIAKSSNESVDKGLVGKVAGVRMSTDNGDPGAAANIQIRGVASVSASTQPLYVIDGVVIDPATNDDVVVGYKSTAVLNTINPNDVESMTVLKDAAASSLYGSRAANGVIIITTKSGKAGKTTVSYNGEVGITQLANMKAFDIMDGPTFMQWVADSYDGYYQQYGYESYAQASGYAGKSVDLMKEEGWFYNPDATKSTSTKWQNEVFRNALTHSHQISVNGGNEKTKFYAGLGYTSNEGVVIGSSFERISGRINLDHNVNKWFSASFRQMISSTETKGYSDQSDQAQGWGNASPTSSIFQQDPTAPVRDADGNFLNGTSWSGTVDNPHIAFEDDSYEYYNTTQFRSLSGIDFKIKFTDYLNLKNTFGYDFVDSRQYLWWGPTSVDGGSYEGLKTEYDIQSKTLTNSTILNFNKSYGKHNVSALAGWEIDDHRTDYITAATSKFPTDKLTALSVGQTYNAGGSKSRSFMASVLAKADYNYDNKYYVSASFRRDGSSRLGPDSRWANFWSVSAAWRVSQENFLANSDLFSDLKIKASYGTNGNLPGSYYSYKGLYAMGAGYGDGSAIYWSNPDNDSLGWEKTKNFNVGFEWNMFNRVQFNVEYYNKYTSSLLFPYPASIVSGFASYTANIGNIRNQGIEVEVSSTNIKRGSFSWTTDFNITWQKNKIVTLPDGEDIAAGDGNLYLLREGESMYTFNLPVYMGVNRETGLGEFLIDPDGSRTDPANRTNYYSEAGSTIVGKAIPDVIGGMTNTFNWWRFDLSFLLSYQFGGKLFDYMEYFTVSDGMRMGSFNQLAKAGDYWTPENKDAKYPKVIYGNPYRSDRWSTRHIKSTDNIRMRDLTFGYTHPFTKGIQSLRVYFKTTNPFMVWSATPDVDPDVPINGYRTVDVPVTRSFVFGVNVTF
ncbi:MAG: TonB-dependent receptor [Bacteroidales bacterium]|nr:TonB-dependent receptor [Bacteroidales bacterium]